MVIIPKSQFAITIMIIIAIALIIIAILIRKILEYQDIIIDLIDYIDDTHEIEEIYQQIHIQDQYLNKQIVNKQILNQKAKKDGKKLFCPKLCRQYKKDLLDVEIKY